MARNSEQSPRALVSLPPVDVRLWNPVKQGLIETPLDDLGRADLDALVELVKSTAEPDYDWKSAFNDIHHLQWPAAQYHTNGDMLSADFRELAPRKAFLPRVFHNWTHRITLPPPIPKREVMMHSVRSYHIALNLATTAGLALRLADMTELPEGQRQSRLARELETYQLYTEQAREVPAEYQFFALQDIEVAGIDDLYAVNRLFGKIALHLIPARECTVEQAAS